LLLQRCLAGANRILIGARAGSMASPVGLFLRTQPAMGIQADRGFLCGLSVVVVAFVFRHVP
jgi:hypothetical protein